MRLYEYVNREIEKGREMEKVAATLQRRVRSAGTVYARFGLARPHLFDDEGENSRKKCYVQILGIHTFPDYLPK